MYATLLLFGQLRNTRARQSRPAAHNSMTDTPATQLSRYYIATSQSNSTSGFDVCH
jgi:hypothetical protein